MEHPYNISIYKIVHTQYIAELSFLFFLIFFIFIFYYGCTWSTNLEKVVVERKHNVFSMDMTKAIN